MNYYFFGSIIIILGIILGYLIGKLTYKVIKPTNEEIIHLSIKNVKFLESLNPIVVLLYKAFINDGTVKYFKEESHHINYEYLDIKFWSANDIYARQFTAISDNILKKYNLTFKDANQLTLADKKILDLIANQIKINNKQFIDRVFI